MRGRAQGSNHNELTTNKDNIMNPYSISPNESSYQKFQKSMISIGANVVSKIARRFQSGGFVMDNPSEGYYFGVDTLEDAEKVGKFFLHQHWDRRPLFFTLDRETEELVQWLAPVGMTFDTDAIIADIIQGCDEE
jgi:hypothetical protein